MWDGVKCSCVGLNEISFNFMGGEFSVRKKIKQFFAIFRGMLQKQLVKELHLIGRTKVTSESLWSAKPWSNVRFTKLMIGIQANSRAISEYNLTISKSRWAPLPCVILDKSWTARVVMLSPKRTLLTPRPLATSDNNRCLKREKKETSSPASYSKTTKEFNPAKWLPQTSGYESCTA